MTDKEILAEMRKLQVLIEKEMLKEFNSFYSNDSKVIEKYLSASREVIGVFEKIKRKPK